VGAENSESEIPQLLTLFYLFRESDAGRCSWFMFHRLEPLRYKKGKKISSETHTKILSSLEWNERWVHVLLKKTKITLFIVILTIC